MNKAQKLLNQLAEVEYPHYRKYLNSEETLTIFICHAKEDRKEAEGLYNNLLKDGFNPWLNKKDLLLGCDWKREIGNMVQKSDAVIVLLSKSSTNKVGYVQKEIKLALETAENYPEGDIFLLPLRIEECEIIDSLKGIHYVDLFDEEGYELLMRALREKLSKKYPGKILITLKDLLNNQFPEESRPNYKEMERIIKAEGLQIIIRRNRNVEVQLNDKTMAYTKSLSENLCRP